MCTKCFATAQGGKQKVLDFFIFTVTFLENAPTYLNAFVYFYVGSRIHMQTNSFILKLISYQYENETNRKMLPPKNVERTSNRVR